MPLRAIALTASSIALAWLYVGFLTYASQSFGPISVPPPGWAHLQRTGLDTRTGAYHDSVSGAFVDYDIGAPTVIAPPEVGPGDELATGQLEGVEYRFVRRPVQCEDSGENTYDRSARAYFTFSMKHLAFSVWNFWTTVCSASQDERVQQLLLSELRFPRDGATPERSKHGRDILEAELLSLRKGMTWDEVRNRMGPSANAEGTRGGGFAVLYGLDAPPHETIWLCFDVSQRFVNVCRMANP